MRWVTDLPQLTRISILREGTLASCQSATEISHRRHCSQMSSHSRSCKKSSSMKRFREARTLHLNTPQKKYHRVRPSLSRHGVVFATCSLSEISSVFSRCSGRSGCSAMDGPKVNKWYMSNSRRNETATMRFGMENKKKGMLLGSRRRESLSRNKFLHLAARDKSRT